MGTLLAVLKTNTKIRVGISLLVTLVSLLLILRSVDLTQLANTWVSLDWVWIAPACAIYLANLILRAWRLRILFSKKLIPFTSGLRISCYFSVINFLIPARLGEISLPWMLAQQTGLKFSGTIFTVVCVRLIELIAALALLLVLFLVYPDGLLMMWGRASWSLEVAVAIMAAGILVTAIAGKLWRSKSFKINLDWPIWAMSLGVMFFAFLQTVAICRLLNVESPLQVAPMIFFASLLLRFIPVNGLANVGGLHAAWALPLVIMGYSSAHAVEVSVWAHLFITSLTVVFGLSGYLLSRGNA